MYLVRLVYASTVSDAYQQDDLKRILEVSRRNNARNHISGALCFSDRYFLQCLEGSRDAVNQTYRVIMNDERHCDLVLLEYSEVDSRFFTAWTMGYLPAASLPQPLHMEADGDPDFSLRAMSGERALGLLCSARESIEPE